MSSSDSEDEEYFPTPAATVEPLRPRRVQIHSPLHGRSSPVAHPSVMEPAREPLRPIPFPPLTAFPGTSLEQDVEHLRLRAGPSAWTSPKVRVSGDRAGRDQSPYRPPVDRVPSSTLEHTGLLDRVRDPGSRLSAIDRETLAQALASVSGPSSPPRREARAASPRPPPSRSLTAKLHPYDGTSEPLETFLARFENFSSHYRWEEDERLFHLRNSLANTVGNVLWDSGSPTSSSDLITLLRSRYGTEHQADRFRMELKTRRRTKGEKLQSLFLDIKRLMALAYPGQTGSIIETTCD